MAWELAILLMDGESLQVFDMGSLLFYLSIGEMHLLGIEAVIVVVVGLKLAELELQLELLV